MSFSSTFIKGFCSLLMVLSLSVLAFADTIRLKDGSILKGRIISFSGGKFTIAIGEGSRLKQLTYSASEIESIQFDDADKAPLTIPARTNSANPAIINTNSTTSNTPRVVTTSNIPRPNTPAVKQSVNTASGKASPINWTVRVLADNTSNGWTNSGWVLKKGQRIRISGDGTVSLGRGRSSSPSGDPGIADEQKLLKSVATGALIAVIGDDNNDFIYIGAEREFTATRDGALFLGINEGILDDNTGSFTVKIEILPTGN